MFRSGKTRTIVVMVLLASLLVGAGVLFNSSLMRNAFITISAPASKAGIIFSGKASALARSAFYFRQQGDENRRLIEENQQLRSQAVNYQETLAENELLRKQLGEQKQKAYTLALADIVSYDPFHFAQYALISKGSQDGIAENMPVIMAGNILFGKVYKTYPHFAQVMLIADKNNKVSIQTQGTNVSGVLSGSNGGALLMDLLEKTASLDSGNLVVTSGLDGIYPKDLIVGTISQVISQTEGIFKQAYVHPAYSSFEHTQVFIITDYAR